MAEHRLIKIDANGTMKIHIAIPTDNAGYSVIKADKSYYEFV